MNEALFSGKYRIVKTLGRGGMSTVYLAENVKLGTLWAIKKIPKNADSRLNILVEPNILRKLNHPSLPRIFDIVEDEYSIYIIVDYIEGISLDKELASVGKFPEETVIAWAKQIGSVLHYLHTQQPNPIIYRDMKPSNIMLTKEGAVKLIDFGIAREYKAQSESDTIYIGTRGYAAPEQYGIGQTSPATDIYSFGVTLYHLMTGKSPNEPPYEIKPVRAVEPGLSKGIEKIIAKCTRLNPEERYPSVQELMADIERMNLPDALAVQPSRPPGTRAVSFKRLILTIWDNAQFACELAYAAAKLTNLNVLIINLDFISPKLDIYLGLKKKLSFDEKKKTRFEELKRLIDGGTLKCSEFKAFCSTGTSLANLYILNELNDIHSYDEYKELDLSSLIEYSYQNFDITFLAVNKYVFNEYTKLALQKSDFNLLSISANVGCIREFERYIRFASDRYGVAPEKTRLVAWEYKEGIHLPRGLLKKVYFQGCFIECVDYSADREKYSNLENSCYARWAYKRHALQYRKILMHFGMVARKPISSVLSDFLRFFAVKMKKSFKRLGGIHLC